MPNEKNVAALARIIEELSAEHTIMGDPIPQGDAAVELAKLLADRGVLVPSALTVQQMTGDLWRHDTEDGTAALIVALKRIARGESP